MISLYLTSGHIGTQTRGGIHAAALSMYCYTSCGFWKVWMESMWNKLWWNQIARLWWFLATIVLVTEEILKTNIFR